MLTGRVFAAAEALSGGLVREVATDRLMPRAIELAREISENTSPVSVAMSRQMLWRMLLGAAHPMEAHRIDSRGSLELGRASDAAEGVTSFLEKRSPNFQMKPSADMPPVYPWWEEPGFF